MLGEDQFTARVSTVAAADAARDLVGNSAKGIWRALPDGSIEVARPRRARVELYVAQPDGATQLIDASRRSVRRAVAEAGAVGCWGLAALSIVGLMFTDGKSEDNFGVALVGAVALFVLFCLLGVGGARVRPWIRERCGTDADWTIVPRQVSRGFEPTSGNQLITAAAMADAEGGSIWVRKLDDGQVEVMTTRRKRADYYVIDTAGTAALADSDSGKGWLTRAPLEDWHVIRTDEPGD